MHYPEFLLNFSEFPGTPVGRLFVPYRFTTQLWFIHFCESVHIIHIKPYKSSGAQLIWFLASASVYRRLANSFPHHRYSAYTHYLLDEASTFFSRLKPPYFPFDGDVS